MGVLYSRRYGIAVNSYNRGGNPDKIRDAVINRTGDAKNLSSSRYASALGNALADRDAANFAENPAAPNAPTTLNNISAEQRAFAPQMQMPYSQGLPPRVQSGMQFGSAPNPMQPRQMQQPRQPMPVFNSGPVPQYGQNTQYAQPIVPRGGQDRLQFTRQLPSQPLIPNRFDLSRAVK